ESLMMSFVALDDMTEENGCLELIPGSHLTGRHQRCVLGPRGWVDVDARPGRVDVAAAERVVIEKGAVIFMHGRAYHASAVNRARAPRRALIVQVMSGISKMVPGTWIDEPPGGFSLIA